MLAKTSHRPFVNPVTLAAIERAAATVYQFGRVTPLLPSMFLGHCVTHGNVFLKLENMQLTGSFKFRGAFNKIAQLTAAEKRRGIITASAGNHAQGVALTAKLLGIQATVVMPIHAPKAKQEATTGYGAKVILAGETFDECRLYMEAMAAHRALVIVDPYDDADVIAGQGSIGLELLEQLPQVDTIIVPIGGGGLIAGVATAVKALRPAVHIIGVQSQNVHGMAASYVAGRLSTYGAGPTLADGTAVATPGAITYPICARLVDEIVLVDETAIATAMKDLMARTKIMVEGAGALAVAAIESGAIDAKWLKNRNVVAIVSGGNVDLSRVAHNLNQFLAMEASVQPVR